MVNRIDINLEDLKLAFEDASGDRAYYLDTETGEVVLITDSFGFIEAERQREMVSSAPPGRFRAIPVANSVETLQEMESFIDTVEDERLLELLERSLDSADVRQRFNRVLDDYPAERERWSAFHDRLLTERIRSWLAGVGVEPA